MGWLRKIWNALIAVPKFLIDDFKSDIKTIKTISKRLNNDEPVFRPGFKEDLKKFGKEFSFAEILKEYWMGILFCVLCFVIGWWLSSQYYAVECTNFLHSQLEIARASGKYGQDSV